ncbi:MAG TPA: phospholipase D family protein [Ktedonobacteraceae bacterium]|nr:phospholipase D family protein [Ktedonobacteraceae bacterium]
MQTERELQEQPDVNWWASGDTPVRNDARVMYLVDGSSAMLTLCRHFIKANKYIYLADWGLSADIQMVRGSYHRAGPDGSAEQEALLNELRLEGFSDQDIHFWCTSDLSLRHVLGYSVSKGVEVKVLLWDAPPIFSSCNPPEARDALQEVGVNCILDPSAHGILHHPVESLHQKTAIVDGTHAFVGGVDLLIEAGGEFDRWDTPMHDFETPLRRNDKGETPHPWHDVHSLIEGTAVGDVELNFRQRWNDVVTHHHLGKEQIIPDRPIPPPQPGTELVQVVRTIPQHTYHFGSNDSSSILDIAQVYVNALSQVQRFVYLENQYFWLRGYSGIDISLLGFDSIDMQHNITQLGAALQRGAFVSLILPDHPNAGRAFSDAGIQQVREEASQAEEEGRFQVFCLATSARLDGQERYRPIYVHAKVAVVDDRWSTAGSANLNNRGMHDDTEINVAALDSRLARNLRIMLQAEHLGLVHAQNLYDLSRLLGRQVQGKEEQARAVAVHDYLEEQLGDPLVALQKMHATAWENLQRYKAKQPLVGHLLPYLTAEEAQLQGLDFYEEHGWVEEVSDDQSNSI